MKPLLLIVMTTLAISCNGQVVDNSTVDYLDTPRYLGRWYEIARYDHSFERGVDYATADYSLMPNGKIRVTNQGVKKGKVKISKGKAKLTDHQGLLRVSFFWPFFSDYRVLMVSDDYQYALVGSKSADYLWILSRSPQLPYEATVLVLDEATRRGYAIEDLIWVPQ